MPRLTASRAASTITSTDNRSTPGIEAMALRLALPSSTNSGQIRSLAESACSDTRRRAQGALRLRRRRTAGKLPADSVDAARAVMSGFDFGGRGGIHTFRKQNGNAQPLPGGVRLGKQLTGNVVAGSVNRRFWCACGPPYRRGNGCDGPHWPPAQAWCRRSGRPWRGLRAGKPISPRRRQ